MADNESKTTTDHDEIRRWAEERDGKPATVKGTESGGEDAGILRIDFPGGEEDRLEEISWDDWFKRCDGGKPASLYQGQAKAGDERRCSTLATRGAAAGEDAGASAAGRPATSPSASSR